MLRHDMRASPASRAGGLALVSLLAACGGGNATSRGGAPPGKYAVLVDEVYGLRIETKHELHKAPPQSQEATTPRGTPVNISGYSATYSDETTLTIFNVQVVETKGGEPKPPDLTCAKTIRPFFARMQQQQIECAMPKPPPMATEIAPGVTSVQAELGACKDGNLKPTLRVLCDDRHANRVVFAAFVAQAEPAAAEDVRHFMCSAQIGGTQAACP